MAIETSASQGSIALLEESDQGRRLLAAININRSEGVAGSLAQLLTATGVQKNEIGFIAVSKGPGSLTGIRNGRAFAKGLTDSLRIGSREVSLLDALSILNGHWRKYHVAISTGRQEISVCLYADHETIPKDPGAREALAITYDSTQFKELLKSYFEQDGGMIVTRDLYEREDFGREMNSLRNRQKVLYPEVPLAALIGTYADSN